MLPAPLIEARQLKKVYQTPAGAFEAQLTVDLDFRFPWYGLAYEG